MPDRRIGWLLLFLSLVLARPAQGFDKLIRSRMYHDPELPMPRVVVEYKGATDLWLKALARPEADLKCQAADTIALAQHRGVAGLPSTIGPLRTELNRPDQHPAVLLAVAKALVTLEARQTAPSLFQQAQIGGADLREIIEPALAHWDYRPARAIWLARLRDRSTPQRSLILAIRALAVVNESQAVPPLRALLLSAAVPGPVRLEAARALGSLSPSGLEKDAAGLITDLSPRGLVGRLLAASLLRHHQGKEAVALLLRLMQDASPAVASPAVARLIELDPHLAVPALAKLLASPDAMLRSQGVEILLQTPSKEHIHLLAERLGDEHPSVRVQSRQALQQLAARPRPTGGRVAVPRRARWQRAAIRPLRRRVIAEASRVLAGGQWQGLEQATLLLTQLRHRPAADRLVVLLRFDRPEVYITAAWGLRKLAVRATLRDVMLYVSQKEQRIRSAKVFEPSMNLIDHQLSQLNQFFGQQRYAAADPLLRRFIPRMNGRLPQARAAALWSLSLLRQGKDDPALVAAAIGRLKDAFVLPPEDGHVLWMAAITLGRLKAKDKTAIKLLHSFYKGKPSLAPLDNACGWALEEITGEVVPPPQTIREERHDWFLRKGI
jgi:HEAT repeat protein